MRKKILLPIDLSQKVTANHAATTAAQLSEMSGAPVRVVYIMPKMSQLLESYVPSDVHSREESEARERLQNFVDTYVPGAAEVEVVNSNGSIYSEILGDAERSGCDLIVIASHQPEFSDYLLGSNAAKVVRHAKCDVYVVRN